MSSASRRERSDRNSTSSSLDRRTASASFRLSSGENARTGQVDDVWPDLDLGLDQLLPVLDELLDGLVGLKREIPSTWARENISRRLSSRSSFSTSARLSDIFDDDERILRLLEVRQPGQGAERIPSASSALDLIAKRASDWYLVAGEERDVDGEEEGRQHDQQKGRDQREVAVAALRTRISACQTWSPAPSAARGGPRRARAREIFWERSTATSRR